ncbi:hypothetical protein LJ754_12730 [Arthrobacter sp. zg-Y40]|uniref:hypothetical protein n=1 Tax=unclassified Arthrobacter TaxID=235627 RepID=UPI001D13DCDC|nr:MULTISPECIES: hypothetical protein [unclassified Arthrobacter]MCC3280017.1 hypothetical protein [Arthrobacter sp. zg-Y40]MDK1328367.1 hypothetical protein [Arthrobacter sp. zg-Y1143]
MSQSQKHPLSPAGPAKPVRDLPLLSRLVLFFTPFRRKALGFLGAAATWLLLGLLPEDDPWHPVRVLQSVIWWGTWTFATVVLANRLRRPLALPQQHMLALARERYGQEESWPSPKHPEQVLDAVVRAFPSPGAAASRIGESVLVELGRAYRPATGHAWRHQDAVVHLKFRPVVLVFAVPGPDGTGTQVHALSRDEQRTGMFDVLSLADEMTAGAVEAVRAATTG